MAHPFQKIFTDALKQSTALDNLVFEKANELIAKGYRRSEVVEVLKALRNGLIDSDERQIVAEAYDELVGEED